MRCPYCGNPDTRVIDSRPAEDKSSIRRRRSCDECGKRFTTYEKVETIPLIVIKKDNNREQYQRSKIENGVLSACYKRPVPADQIQKTIEAIELEIFNREEKEIPSSVIGELVMDKLKKVEYMEQHIGEEYEGVISGVTGWGLYVELPNTVEGLIHISTIPGDYYHYNEAACEMVGEATGRCFKLGMPVRIEVEDCDRFMRTINFRLVDQ